MRIGPKANCGQATPFNLEIDLFPKEFDPVIMKDEIANVFVRIKKAVVVGRCDAHKIASCSDRWASCTESHLHFPSHRPILEEAQIVGTEPSHDRKQGEQAQSPVEILAGFPHVPDSNDPERQAEEERNDIPHELTAGCPNLSGQVRSRSDWLIHLDSQGYSGDAEVGRIPVL